MFSRRLPPHADLNALTEALARRAGRGPVVDLTESNPTRARIEYPLDLLRGLSAPGALHYEPHAFGLPSARDAIARDHLRRDMTIDPAHIVLTASTSEAYTWLFKLLCNPGESVLVPRPSYPLFEHLTRLEGVCPIRFDLEYHGRWEIDPAALDAAPVSTRAIVFV
jgi:alanine-synthesizing transaminase